jgi:diguanylate cyclase (GGDEF)-like protein/PAS domain S-box-containing protein
VIREESNLSEFSDRWRRTSPAVYVGVLVAVLAAFVMLGWLVRVPWMVQIIPGTTAMVFSNAACMFLLGIALILITVQRPWCKPAQTVIGIGVLMLGMTVMAQYRFDLALPLDLVGLHAWLNGNPGRMAPNTALAHALAGMTVLLATYARPGVRALPALIDAFLVALLGITGLVGYRLHPELLYGWHVETRMALHTGAAFVLLGSGLAAGVYRTQQLGEFFRQREDLRVGMLGGALMVFVGVVGGVVAFALMQDQMVSVLQNGLKLSFQSRHDLIVSEISSSIEATRNFASRPGVQRELVRLRTNPDHPAAVEFLKATLTANVQENLTGARLHDARGRLVASVGSITIPGERVALPLQTPGDVALFWDGRAAGLHVTRDIEVHGQRLGRIESGHALPGITRMREVALGFGASSDMVLCVRPADVIRCLPTVLHPDRTEIPAATQAGPTLIVSALAGKNGVGLGTDYRGERVIAAYGPVGDLDLGLVLKVDVAEIYAPLRQRFELTLLVTALVVVAGIVLLHSRLVPLVRRLASSERRYRGLLEQAPDGVFVADLDGRYTDVNDAGCRLLGYARDEIIGKTIVDLIPPADVERLMQSREQMLAGGAHVAEWTLRHKDGTWLPVEVSAKILPDGRWQGFVRDISERRRAMQALRDSEQRWQFALEGARDGVWDWNLVTNEVYFSLQWKSMLGYAENEIADKLEEWDKRVHPEDKAGAYADIQKHLNGETPYYQNEHRLRCKDGNYKWILDRGMIVSRDADGKPTRMIGTHTDITDHKHAEETIRELSLVDDLTGLRNRRGFFVLGESQLSLAQRLGRSAVLYFADVDGLKQINDQFGHEEGDRALTDFAEILRSTFRETDIVARLGGDEFVVLALESPDVDTSASVARFEEHLSQHKRNAGRRYHLTASMGVANLGPESSESLTDLLRRADTEMYRIKQRRRAG